VCDGVCGLFAAFGVRLTFLDFDVTGMSGSLFRGVGDRLRELAQECRPRRWLGLLVPEPLARWRQMALMARWWDPPPSRMTPISLAFVRRPPLCATKRASEMETPGKCITVAMRQAMHSSREKRLADWRRRFHECVQSGKRWSARG
jgi:hypothetical protein